jgi:hypothetical protein
MRIFQSSRVKFGEHFFQRNDKIVSKILLGHIIARYWRRSLFDSEQYNILKSTTSCNRVEVPRLFGRTQSYCLHHQCWRISLTSVQLGTGGKWTGLHGVTSQKIVLFKFIPVRTSNTVLTGMMGTKVVIPSICWGHKTCFRPGCLLKVLCAHSSGERISYVGRFSVSES